MWDLIRKNLGYVLGFYNWYKLGPGLKERYWLHFSEGTVSWLALNLKNSRTPHFVINSCLFHPNLECQTVIVLGRLWCIAMLDKGWNCPPNRHTVVGLTAYLAERIYQIILPQLFGLLAVSLLHAPSTLSVDYFDI